MERRRRTDEEGSRIIPEQTIQNKISALRGALIFCVISVGMQAGLFHGKRHIPANAFHFSQFYHSIGLIFAAETVIICRGVYTAPSIF